MRKNRAVIMDRDGTIFRDGHYLSDPKGIKIYKGVIPALKRLSRQGWKLIVGTNQSGIGRGYFSRQTLEKIHDRFLSICRRNKLKIDEIFICPHHPDLNCNCRKPKVGMLLKAAKKHRLDLKKCVVIGDKASDIEWGKNAKARTVLVMTGTGRSALLKSKAKPDHVSKSLAYAAQWILEHD